MQITASLAEILQQLHAQGYSLADSYLTTLPKESIEANDWRLDMLHQIRYDLSTNYKVLVIGVSSVQRHLKLVFVEVLSPNTDFSPITLLRKLFPTRKASRLSL
jgi:hypothetical protein